MDADHESLSTGDKWNEVACEDGSKENRKSSVKLSSAKSTTVMGYFYSSSEDEDVCPTCLEGDCVLFIHQFSFSRGVVIY